MRFNSSSLTISRQCLVTDRIIDVTESPCPIPHIASHLAEFLCIRAEFAFAFAGSMAGAPETVAKAVTLECMRSAHRQNRACYLYAFGGPNEVLKYFILTPSPNPFPGADREW